LKEKTEEDTRRWKYFLIHWSAELTLWKMAILLKALYRFNALHMNSSQKYKNHKIHMKARWLISVVLGTWLSEMRRIPVPGYWGMGNGGMHLSSQATWEVEIDRISVLVWPIEKSLQDPHMWWHMPVITAAAESLKWENCVPGLARA
jgi:hypothetical protein